jgi:C4-dicarboxylate transporter, DctM subunit
VSVEVIVFFAIALFAVMLLIEVPVAFALGISGITGLVLLRDVSVADSVLASVPHSSTASFTFTIVPMYVLIGMFALNSGMAEQVYDVANRMLRGVRGGLGIATVMACAGFAAVTGSSVATAATIGRISITEMRRHGYTAAFAAGIVAAAGTLGVLIPPSVVLVLYAIITGESIARLLAAGIVPGVLSAVVYMVFILIYGNRGLVVQKALEEDGGSATTTATKSIRGVVYIAIIFGIVVGGLYSGVFTATESGALGALAAMLLMFFELRRKGLRGIWRGFTGALRDSASITSMAFSIVVGAAIFTFFLVQARVPARLTTWLLELDVSPTLIIALLLLALIPLGMALDPISILLITVPLAYPAVTARGFDGIWFGIIMVKIIELSLITPPVGLNVFVVSGASGGQVTVEDGFRGVWPFGLMDAVTVALLFAFPSIILWLPNQINV